MPPALAAIGIGLAAVGTVGSIVSSRNQAKAVNRGIEEQRAAAEAARKAQEKRAALQRRRERIRLLSEARKRRASVTAGAVRQTGLSGLGGSGVQGARGVISQRVGGALGTQTALASSGRELSAASSRMANAQFQTSQAQNDPTPGIFAGIGNLGGSIFSASGSPALKTLLNSSTSAPTVSAGPSFEQFGRG